jgi:hypothetical protein
MDNSRDHDLKALYERFNNPDVPMYARQNAHRTFVKIQRQVKDNQLNELRHRLARASDNNDPDAAERISLQIKDYRRKMGYAEG